MQDQMQHILNQILHWWIKDPEMTISETIYLLKIEGYQASQQLTEYLHLEKCKFKERGTVIPDIFSNLPKEDTPLGVNPFMDQNNE